MSLPRVHALACAGKDTPGAQVSSRGLTAFGYMGICFDMIWPSAAGHRVELYHGTGCNNRERHSIAPMLGHWPLFFYNITSTTRPTWALHSSSSVSSSSSTARAGAGAAAGPSVALLRVAGLPKGNARAGGGGPLAAGLSLDASAAADVALVALVLLDGGTFCEGSSSSSVSSSEFRSGVAAPTSDPSTCSSCLGWSISIWSESDSMSGSGAGAGAGAGSGGVALAGAFRFDVRDAPALRDLVSSLADCTADAAHVSPQSHPHPHPHPHLRLPCTMYTYP